MHIHSIYDTDKHFIIDATTRNVVAESEKLSLTQLDHNSERFTFEIPRMVEGHDMSLCDYVQIHYENTSKNKQSVNKDFYTVTDLQVSPDSDDVVIFSWLISESATQFVGKLKFSIRFECLSETGMSEYSWGTTDFTRITILPCVDNTSSAVVEHSDFVDRMEALAIEMSESKLPSVSTEHNGAFLRVIDGEWAVVEVPNAETSTF